MSHTVRVEFISEIAVSLPSISSRPLRLSWGGGLEKVDTPSPFLQWLHVPSHVGIHGNEQVDKVADASRSYGPPPPRRLG